LLHFYYCNLLQLQVTEKSNLLPVTSLLVTSYYPTLTVAALKVELSIANNNQLSLHRKNSLKSTALIVLLKDAKLLNMTDSGRLFHTFNDRSNVFLNLRRIISHLLAAVFLGHRLVKAPLSFFSHSTQDMLYGLKMYSYCFTLMQI